MSHTRIPRRGKAKHTVFCPFTRLWAVERFFSSLAASDVPFADCRFIAYVDHDDRALEDAVTAAALALPFAAITVHVTDVAPPDDNAGTLPRRRRQGMMRQESVGLIPKATDRLLLLEDDTTVPPNTWKRLSAMLKSGYDWASGFEVGRWRMPCAGIWRIHGSSLDSMMPTAGVEDCDATGIYLVMTRPEVYAARPWDVYDNRWGQDVTVTWMLKQDGYRLGVDWSLRCVHMGPDRDWTCDEVVFFHRDVQPCAPTHLSQIPEVEPPVMVKPRSHYTLGVNVNFEGREYPKGTRIDHKTAVAMSIAGALKACIR